MSATLTAPQLTIDDLLAMDENGPRYELVDGQLEEVHVSALSSAVASKLSHRIRAVTEPGGLGELFDSELYYKCFPWMPGTARKPDLSFVSIARLPEDWAALGLFTIAPDLAAEVLSPNDLAYKVNAKLNEYIRAGVRLVWVIDPEQRMVFVHRHDGTGNTLHETDELNGEDVIPGFRCRVADLFPPRPVVPAATNGA